MKLCPSLAVYNLKAEKAQQGFLMCFIYNMALQKTLLLSYFWVVYITFLSISLNKVLWILSLFFSQVLSIITPHQSISCPSGKRRGVQVLLGSSGRWCLLQGKDRAQQKQSMAAMYTPQLLCIGRAAVATLLE